MAVIWLIAVLSIATMAALRVITFDAEVASTKIHGSRARQVAEMGIARFGRPAEIARVVAFLASGAAEYLQGAIVDADGGATRTL